MEKRKMYTLIIIVGVLFVGLIILFAVASRKQPVEKNFTSAVSPTLSQLDKTTVGDPLTVLKNRMTQPVSYEDLTIEYRKGSNTFIVFYSGPETVAKEVVTGFFKSFGVSDISREKLEYISLDITLDPPQGFYQKPN